MIADYARGVIAGAEDFARIREAAAKPGLMRELAGLVRALAERELAEPVVTRDVRGRRLLHISRLVLRRVINCGIAYQVFHDDRYARRALADLRAAAAFEDWNPSHFLDVAELACAFGLGLDWLHEALGPEEQRLLEDALIRHGLEPGLVDPDAWYFQSTNNWNAVCNAGLLIGVISVRHRRPELAKALVDRCIARLPLHGVNYAPDGAYTEGPMYWDYGTTYHLLAVEALRRHTGSTHGLDTLPGFRESADFLAHATGPGGDFYSYFDSGIERPLLPALLWFGRHYDTPRFTRAEIAGLRRELAGPPEAALRKEARLIALSLLWLKPEHLGADVSSAPLAWSGDGPNPVALWRSAWTADATWVGAKGGKAKVSHGHLDAGSFVFESGGVRWAIDPGAEEYHRLESMGIDLWAKDRWTIFMLGAEGHSIPRIEGVAPDPEGYCPRMFWFSRPLPRVVFDLAALYPGMVKRLQRTIAAEADGRTVWRDDVGGLAAGRTYRFTWLTTADATVDAGGVVLTQSGRRLRLDAVCGRPFICEVIAQAALTRPYETPVPGLKRVDFAVASPGTDFSFQLTASLLS